MEEENLIIGIFMNLVIVESPAKAKTIEKYLGKDFKVLASYGHVRDLPKGGLGVDLEHNYEPQYVISDKAENTIKELKKQAGRAKELYLATDLDREGEAISWHLLSALEWNKEYHRITFSEITKQALERSMQNPRKLNMNLVDAQQARRVLDRLVGYKLSPLLWKKVRAGLSAGRVQSVAVRLVVDKEREIRKFQAQEYWQVQAELSGNESDKKFNALLIAVDEKTISKLDIKSKQEAEEIQTGLENATYQVGNIESKESIRRPSAPFTTSTLQMESSRKFGYSAKYTMMLAQKLYEAGKITYMRTDSTSLSADSLTAIRALISNDFGNKYLPDTNQIYQTKTKRAQEAHEAIRPSDVNSRNASGDGSEQKLYELIWKRTVASQMNGAIFDIVNVKIIAQAKKKYTFFVKGETLKFDGFIKVYTEGKDDEIDEDKFELPKMTVGEMLKFWQLLINQKFTEPPKRYSEATLVKKLESLGIGRPSTYAPTLATIQDRGYTHLEEKRFVPEEVGEIVTDLLVNNFPNIVDYDFTAKMEDQFDDVADGKSKWQEIIAEFYLPFSKELDEKQDSINKQEILGGMEIDEVCPECGKKMTMRMGKYGKFLSCSGYPDCKYAKPADGKEAIAEEVSDEKCPKCGGDLIMKQSRFGKFWACKNYPKCKYTKNVNAGTGIKCPDCSEGEVSERRTKKGKKFWSCSRYPDCKYATWEKPSLGESSKS